MTTEISLTSVETKEAEDGILRLDPLDMRLLNVQPGDYVALAGQRTTAVRVRAAFMEDRNQRLASMGTLLRLNLGIAEGDKIRVQEGRLRLEIADKIKLQAEDDLDALNLAARVSELAALWHGRAVSLHDLIALPGMDRHPLIARIAETTPAGPVLIGSGTAFVIAPRAEASPLLPLGGLRDPYRLCRDLAVARLKDKRESAACSVLLLGPSGCGKARLVARLAEELGMPLVTVDAQQLIDRAAMETLPEAEIALSTLMRKPDTLLLIDHMESLANEEGGSEGGIAVAKRMVTAQLAALLDDIRLHPNVMAFVVASQDLASRFMEHDRIDLVLPIDAPNRIARHEILTLATKGVPLDPHLDLGKIATMTQGATARDLKRLVATASRLSAGPQTTESDFVSAFRSIAPSAASDVRCDIPIAAWDDVVGLDETKQLLSETLAWSLKHREKFADAGVRPPCSILLSGGRGTGKTMLCRALAAFVPLNFIEIACPLLASRKTADAVRFIRESFALARRKAPCLIFFDDIDVLFEIAGPTSSDAPHLHPVVAQLLAELDAINLIFGVVVIAATNRPDRLSSEVLRPGRFDYALTLPMPDTQARKKIFEIHAHKLPLAADVDFGTLAAATHGMSPADIANLCSRVGLMALRQSLNSGDGATLPPVVNADLFEQSLRGRKS